MKVYTVSEFREEINELLGQVTVAIQGEIAQFHISQNRFVWFTIVDEDTSVDCFMMAFQLRVPLEEGMEVRLVGSPNLFKKGKFVFRPRQVDLVGEGSLRQAFEMLKKKLEKEGLFAAGRKRALPRFPQRIGLITSRDAAAYTDVLRILRNRWSGLEIRHVNVNVQGVQAVPSITGAFAQLNEEHQDLDCILLTRGGGSLEDLQAFNSEEVARAIFASRIPVITGIGHERDDTLSDFVADIRCSTPSNAAETLVPNKADVIAEMANMARHMEHAMMRGIQSYEDNIDAAVHALDRRARQNVLQFTDLERRLQFAMERFSGALKLRLENIARSRQLLHSFNPTLVLKRGYSMTLDENGRIIKSTRQVRAGQRITTRLQDGDLRSVAE